MFTNKAFILIVKMKTSTIMIYLNINSTYLKHDENDVIFVMYLYVA